jgi:hypothetical protein
VGGGIENKYFDLEDEENHFFNLSDSLQSRIEHTTKMKIDNPPHPLKIKWSSPKPTFYLVV